MPTVITASSEEILGGELRRDLRIPRPSITSLDFLLRRDIIEREADEARVTLLRIILQRIVHDTVRPMRDEVIMSAPCQSRSFEQIHIPQDVLARRIL